MQIKIGLIILHVIISSSIPTKTFYRKFNPLSHIYMTDKSRECTILNRNEKVKILRSILNDTSAIAVMPCCYDGMSAKLVESAGFHFFTPITSMITIKFLCRLSSYIHERICCERLLRSARHWASQCDGDGLPSYYDLQCPQAYSLHW